METKAIDERIFRLYVENQDEIEAWITAGILNLKNKPGEYRVYVPEDGKPRTIRKVTETQEVVFERKSQKSIDFIG